MFGKRILPTYQDFMIAEMLKIKKKTGYECLKIFDRFIVEMKIIRSEEKLYQSFQRELILAYKNYALVEAKNIQQKLKSEYDNFVTNVFSSIDFFIILENQKRNEILREENHGKQIIGTKIMLLQKKHPLEKIPFAQKIAKFACRYFPDVLRISQINSTFRETFEYYNLVVCSPFPRYSGKLYTKIMKASRSNDISSNSFAILDFLLTMDMKVTVAESILGNTIYTEALSSAAYRGNYDFVKKLIQYSYVLETVKNTAHRKILLEFPSEVSKIIFESKMSANSNLLECFKIIYESGRIEETIIKEIHERARRILVRYKNRTYKKWRRIMVVEKMEEICENI